MSCGIYLCSLINALRLSNRSSRSVRAESISALFILLIFLRSVCASSNKSKSSTMIISNSSFLICESLKKDDAPYAAYLILVERVFNLFRVSSQPYNVSLCCCFTPETIRMCTAFSHAARACATLSRTILSQWRRPSRSAYPRYPGIRAPILSNMDFDLSM